MVLVVQTDAPSWDSRVFEGIGDVDVEAVSAAFGTVEVVARGREAGAVCPGRCVRGGVSGAVCPGRCVRGGVSGAVCPDCGRFADRVHDRFQRRLKDLPLADQGFVIRLTVRRFICGSAGCPRRTFAEPFSRLAAPHARFTRRLNLAPERVGPAVAGRAGARLAAQLGFGVGRMILLRRVMASYDAGTAHESAWKFGLSRQSALRPIHLMLLPW
ncbi:transposase family protein [Streptomyces sp. NPDC086033]|uniref:transposase family protein n=1 Tax=Streptomyces sp. NPDC086033 TaxID=3365747 RepID=UPI0037D0A7B2